MLLELYTLTQNVYAACLKKTTTFHSLKEIFNFYCIFIHNWEVCVSFKKSLDGIKLDILYLDSRLRMGIQDHTALFNNLDTACKGFVTNEQIVEFYQSIYLAPVAIEHVDGAIQAVCGTLGTVTRWALLFYNKISWWNTRGLIEP